MYFKSSSYTLHKDESKGKYMHKNETQLLQDRRGILQNNAKMFREAAALNTVCVA